ncbi:protein PSK SIMULATOR 1 [Malania oleifera]|uniref:protein PSK SIMULATOR 1 n=1 Tax=Malania oleifera TaxID=397392 RepID=UPI0025AE9F79|nr:protein PSK SIMULATOR 1 [Malania oleifera]
MVAESWFRSLWRPSRKHEVAHEKVLVGVLAFEVASLMSKLVHLWQSLGDKQVVKLRDEIMNSVGIRKLVSEDDDFLVGLICAEIIENLRHVVRSVTRLTNKCNDPSLKSFEYVFNDFIKLGVDPSGWEFSWKKMERKVKKMERFICANATLYQEMEILAELEQTFRRMKGSDDHHDTVALHECQKKFVCKQQEVKNLKDISLWNRTYDYTGRLLARSVFTIFGRIRHVFGINQMADIEEMENSRTVNSDCIYHSQSLAALMKSSDHQSENSVPRFSSGPLGISTTKTGPVSKMNKTNYFHSGPLGNELTKSGPISGAHKSVDFYSGPLEQSKAKSGMLSGTDKSSKRLWNMHGHSPTFHGKKLHPKHYRLTQVGPFKGCMMAGNSSPVSSFFLSSNGIHSIILDGNRDTNSELHANGNALHGNISIFNSKSKLLNALPETLGAAALALHYANVIIVIEKLVASPHLIGQDARDDLYNMLPASVRGALRTRLKPCAKSLTASVCDTALAGEWGQAMAGILEWLAPLAHNMIRWQAERSFEQQSLVSRTNVLLVQTLYFANQERTEAAITELLVGLNYVWRFGRELNAKALLGCASSSIFDEYLDLEG